VENLELPATLVSRYVLQNYEQCCGSGWIPDPAFSIPDPGLARSRIRIKEFRYFLPKTDTGTKVSTIRFGMFIPDPVVKKAPDPGSGSATLITTI
jgi:hypothetical protein